MQLTGAQALIKSLEMEGTEVMFGLPGGPSSRSTTR
jgi:acetolactate synthase-1/2/3 large subunit